MNGLEWLRPSILAVLALVPVAIGGVVSSVKRRRRALDRFAEQDVRRRTQELPAGRPWMRGLLLVTGLAGLVLAAAGPQWGTAPAESVPVGQEVVFAIDVSRSMLARDVDPSRLDRARRVVRQLLARLPSAEAGLVVFAGEASLAVPLTRDTGAVDLYLSSAAPDWISDPSTDLGRAVQVSLDAFGPERAPGRAIVLLSDGEDHGEILETAIEAAADRGIEVDAVGVGTTAGSRIPLPGGEWVTEGDEPVVTRLDPEALEAATRGTGGELALVTDEASLARLAGRLSRLDTGDEAGRAEERRADRYRWPLAVAVLALAGEALLAIRGRRVAPEAAAVLALALLGMGRAQDPEELYGDGRYEDALRVWSQADRSPGAQPSDAYNRASAAYRLGRHREAAASYAVAARTAGTRARAEAGWYNAGNGRFRMAEQVESASPARSLRYWDNAVAAYREALLRDPADRDAKHNLELALRRRQEASGGGGGGGSGGGQGEGGGSGGGGAGMQPPSSGTEGAAGTLTRDQAERLLDALAAQEQEALIRGGGRRGRATDRPGW